MNGRFRRSAMAEARPYIDGQLHCYRSEDLAGDSEFVTPGCAEISPWYAIDHERSLIGDRVEHPERGEIDPGCLVWARKYKVTLIQDPRPAERVDPAAPVDAVTTLPASAGAIRGSL